MLVETGGKERSASEYKHLLEKHGFVDVQAKRVYFSKDAILCKKLSDTSNDVLVCLIL